MKKVYLWKFMLYAKFFKNICKNLHLCLHCPKNITLLIRERGDIGLFITLVPKVLQYSIFYSLAQHHWGLEF